MKIPDSIWVIFDSFLKEEPHVFNSKKKAKKAYKQWKKDAEGDDSFVNEVSKPIKYSRIR